MAKIIRSTLHLTVPGYLCPKHIAALRVKVADPTRGLSYSPAQQAGLITEEEYNWFSTCTNSDYIEISQMLACFVLLAHNIPLEV